ncbi:MAG: 30S ribosomal protein S9 [Candidatus Moranbacteria bacterium]|nr:30S ribosomal protein S9 [Candidatus Moranbacteria bacterium]
MATTKKVTTKKATTTKTAVAKKKEAVKDDRYVYAVGRRKTAVAQVRLYAVSQAETMMVNNRTVREYFGTLALETVALSPLKACGLEEAFKATVLVRGGGLNGQADAIKLGVARALLKHDVLLRPTLKAQGFLTRDARAVERKKPGLKKARRAPQWAKR